jgi:hypothetical protein
MAYPKQIKKTLPLKPQKELLARREQLLDYITRDGTYLPKSVLHADLDRGMLDFCKDKLQTVTSGKVVPFIDIIITTQNWAQFTETWNFSDLDKNVEVPFMTVVRNPEVKYGSNPALIYNIPNRRQYYFATVPTWDGQRKGVDIYTIPQPVPVDITYSLKIMCNRMRELNQLNKIIMQTFASRQAYTFVKGHFVPIILQNVGDESVMEMDRRKYYIQSYDFLMMGFLIDEEEFQVKPAISRTVQLLETSTKSFRRGKKVYPENATLFPLTFNYNVGTTAYTENYKYTANLLFDSSTNVSGWEVYLNDSYYGDDVSKIQLTSGDNLTINVTPTNPSETCSIVYIANLV